MWKCIIAELYQESMSLFSIVSEMPSAQTRIAIQMRFVSKINKLIQQIRGYLLFLKLLNSFLIPPMVAKTAKSVNFIF